MHRQVTVLRTWTDGFFGVVFGTDGRDEWGVSFPLTDYMIVPVSDRPVWLLERLKQSRGQRLAPMTDSKRRKYVQLSMSL